MEQRSLSLQSSSVFGPWLGSRDDTSMSPRPLAAIPEAHTQIFFCFATIHVEELQLPSGMPPALSSPCLPPAPHPK